MKSRAVKAFVGVVCIGGLLFFAAPALGVTPGGYWIAVFVLAFLAAAGVSRSAGSGSSGTPAGEFLCDDCKYNDPRYCGKPERPNATRCPDYRQR